MTTRKRRTNKRTIRAWCYANAAGEVRGFPTRTKTLVDRMKHAPTSGTSVMLVRFSK